MKLPEAYRYCLLVLRRMQVYHDALRKAHGVEGPHFHVNRDTAGQYHREYNQIVEEYLVGCGELADHGLSYLAAIYLHYPWQQCKWNVPPVHEDPRWIRFVALMQAHYEDDYLQVIFDREHLSVQELLRGDVTPAEVLLFRLKM